MSDRGGCIVCGVVMGGEADPLRCHDCVENKYMEQTGTLATFIRITDSGPVAIEAAPPPLDGLTVERLARAVIITNLGPDFGKTGAAAVDYATRLAAEYAALRDEGETT